MRVDPLRVKDIITQVSQKTILPRFNKLGPKQVYKKDHGEIVTIADLEAEKELNSLLKSLLPNSSIIAEETIASHPWNCQNLSLENPIWIIDPLDGTSNFTNGKACFSIIISLIYYGKIEASWIHDPISSSTIFAVRDEGCWEEETKLNLKKFARIEEMTGSFPRGLTHTLRKLKFKGKKGIPNLIDRYRCVGREYMDLARGKLNFLYYSGELKPWDHAAGILIYREIGGYDALLNNKISYDPLSKKCNDKFT